jgi:PPOX class probable F420-dependent enzyme
MARKDISMTEDEIRSFLGEGAKILQVATNGPDGWPHLAPMWYVMDGDHVVFRSFTKSQKIVNLRRDPRLTVLVEDGDSYPTLRGVLIKGRARLVADADYCVELYGRLAARYPMVGETPTPMEPAAVEAAFRRHAEKNTAIVVEQVSVASWDHRKLGGAY